ncbi:hypothetical protein Plec18167_001776 [Paecilomyces lecythidis]|uniref:Mitochondrial protein Fmp25 n=1 Tax=Paecilomyces lecythidis TaxID=3004212 RepID=A0ABR3YAL4_9EURO
MLASRARQPATKAITLAAAAKRTNPTRLQCRYYSSNNQQRPSSSLVWPTLGAIGVGSAAFVGYTYLTNEPQPAKRTPAELTFEKSRTADKYSKEYNRAELSAQHVQVKKSLESPGIYAWGSNCYRVVDPDSDETIVKTPRKISYFDGKVLRDLKLDERTGAAISEEGDLIQWGKGFSETEFKPTKTLAGKDLVSLCMSRNRIIALSSNGNVYSLPISKDEQESGPKPRESSWVPYLGSRARISYRLLQPRLSLGEKVTTISGGEEHVLLLTSSGRVFSAASATDSYPSRGQLGIPGLTWATRPEGPVDACHEITALRGTKIVQISSGDHHSLLLDKDGRVFVFGDNGFGQLGIEFDPAFPYTDAPTLLPLEKLYPGKIWNLKATGIAAGGANSFFTVDATRILGPGEDKSLVGNLGHITADTWAFGKGITGALGNGRWTHLQDAPTKVKALSGLSEYDEKKKSLVPIRLQQLSVGATHASAVLNNSTHLDSSKRSSLSDTNFGSDVLWWGGNEFWQLGTGKRNNIPTPTNINAPPDTVGKKAQTERRLQIIPRHKGKLGNRTVSMEQRVECGKHVSAIYSAV